MNVEEFIMDLDKRLRLIEAHLGFQKFEADDRDIEHADRSAETAEEP